jgi:hypothetical protein
MSRDIAIDWVSVSSSNVEAVAWWYDEEMGYSVLAVAFLEKGPRHPQSVYWYIDVPERLYREMLASRSKGTFLHAHVKKRYFCRPMTGQCAGP